MTIELSQVSCGTTLGDVTNVDYLIIGSGAGASVIAHSLAKFGKGSPQNIAILEEGTLFDDSNGNLGYGKRFASMYRAGGVSPFWGAPPISFAEARTVGGGTVINGGLLWRTPEKVLKEWTAQGLRDLMPEQQEENFSFVENMLAVSLPDTNVQGNLDSLLLAKAANKLNYRCIPVPRALQGCVNSNQCSVGCPSGAKQNVKKNFLGQAVASGVRIFTGAKALKLKYNTDTVVGVTVKTADNRTKLIRPKTVFCAGGATQTPHLLMRSGIKGANLGSLQFHLNIKMVVEFDHKVTASNGTIFTHQVNEFEDDGFYIMASNWSKPLAMATLSHFGPKVSEKVLGNFDSHAMYVLQIRAKSSAHIVSSLFSEPIIQNKFDQRDLATIKKGLGIFTQLMFESGAKNIYFPITGSAAAANASQSEELISKSQLNQYELMSVHAMSSVAMSATPKAGQVDRAGQLCGFKNLFCSDASILPSNIGESPQGTIMALARDVIKRHLDQNLSAN